MPRRPDRTRRRRVPPSLTAGVVLGLLVALGVLGVPAPAHAATHVVDTLSDDVGAPGTTLREAIEAADATVGADTVTFAPSLSGEIDLTQGVIVVDGGDLAIEGPGADVLTVDGNGDQILHFQGIFEAEVSGLTLTGGLVDDEFGAGGAVYVFNTRVTFDDLVFAGNSTVDAPGAALAVVDTIVTVSDSRFTGNSTAGDSTHGGAVYAKDSLLTVRQSTFVGNVTTGTSSAGGAILTTGTVLAVAGSTFSGNSVLGAQGIGGAIAVTGGGPSGLTLVNSTVTGNAASGPSGDAGAIFIDIADGSSIEGSTVVDNSAVDNGGGIGIDDGTLSVTGSVVSGNQAGTASPDLLAISPSTITLDHSLVGDTSGAAVDLSAGGNLVGVDPLLGPLDDHGGPTWTMHPQAGSPVVDAGATTLTTDQRGVVRPQGAADDIGAVEVDAVAPSVTIDALTPPPAADPRAVVTFSSPDADVVAFECRIDGGVYGPCTSPWTTPVVAAGPHTVSVRATDLAGNTGSPDSVTFTPDTTAPRVVVELVTPPTAGDPRATFSFTSPDADVVGFECALDGAAPTSCSSPWTTPDLDPGRHEVAIHAVDSAGNAGPPRVHAFSFDTDGPSVVIDKLTAPTGASRSALVAFSSPDGDAASFECALDDAAYAACTSPWSTGPVGLGAHAVAVRAVDASGTAGTPATETFAWAPSCRGLDVTLLAEPGAVLRGSDGRDVVLGSPGDDEVRGLGGDDVVCGRGGADLVVGGGGADVLHGGAGDDVLHGRAGPDHLIGWRGDDALLGGSGEDVCRGSASDTFAGCP